MNRNLLIAEVMRGNREAVAILADLVEEEAGPELAEQVRSRRPTEKKILKLGLELVSYPLACRLTSEFFLHATRGDGANRKQNRQAQSCWQVLEELRSWSLRLEERRRIECMDAISRMEALEDSSPEEQARELQAIVDPWMEELPRAIQNAIDESLRLSPQFFSLFEAFDALNDVLSATRELITAEILQDSSLLRRKNNRLREALFRLAKLLHHVPRWLNSSWGIQDQFISAPIELAWQTRWMIRSLSQADE